MLMFGFLCFCCKVRHMVVNVGIFVYMYMWPYEGLVMEHNHFDETHDIDL
jgi:hypothetical protein